MMTFGKMVTMLGQIGAKFSPGNPGGLKTTILVEGVKFQIKNIEHVGDQIVIHATRLTRGRLARPHSVRSLEFRGYLKTIVDRDNPSGDFAKDSLRDRTFPDVETWGQLRGYLISHGACNEAIKAAKSVWAAYKRA